MPKRVLLGIDAGTTVLKVCAFDATTGALLGNAAQRLRVEGQADGRREQKTATLDRAFEACIEEVRQALGKQWGSVAGIGLAAQGGSTIVAQRSTGKALTPMILWNDGRAQSQTARLIACTSRRFWQKVALYSSPPAGLARLMWLKEHQPALLTDDNIHVGAGEYLFHRLTGVWRQDAGNAIQIGSYNAVTQQLDQSLLDLVGVPLSFVAPLRQQHETAALSDSGSQLLSLDAGTPVVGPYIDQEAGYLSSLSASARPLHCSLGTAWVGNFILPRHMAGASPTQLVLPSPDGPGRLVVQPLMAGNVTWDWGLEQLLDKSQAKALDKADSIFAESVLPPDGLIAVPWFTQSNPLNASDYGGGAFFGVGAQTNKADLLRALAVGMACELARVFDDLKRSDAIKCVVLGGGASKGAFFRDLIAALFDPMPVVCQTDQDLCVARGAVYAFGKRAAQAKTERVRSSRNGFRERVQRSYELYRNVFDRVYGAVPDSGAFQLERNPG
jgi:sugar (pentulose or hexulose) kinase